MLLGAQSVYATYYVHHNGYLTSSTYGWTDGTYKTAGVMTAGEGNVVYKHYENVPAGNPIEFGIKDDGSGWYVDKDNTSSDLTLSGSNVSFTLPFSTDVTIYFNTSTSKVYVKYKTKYSVTINLVGPASYIYAWSRDDADKIEYFGSGNGSNVCTGSGTTQSPYAYTITSLVPKNAPLKIKFNNNNDKTTYEISAGAISADNKSFTFNIASDYTFWSIKGAFDGWVDHTAPASDPITLSLTNGTYECGIRNTADTWYAGGEDWEDKNITSLNCTEWVLTSSKTSNLNLHTTTSGNYIFTWDNTNAKLTVVYPSYSVVISSLGYATLRLPVEVSIPANMNVYYESSYNLSASNVITVGFTKIAGEGTKYIPAGVPVILKAAEGTYSFPHTTTGVTNPTGLRNEFQGVYSKTDVSSLVDYENAKAYVLQDYVVDQVQTFGFHPVRSTGYIAASRCYLEVASTSALNAPAINMWLEDENGATTIPVFTEDSLTTDNAVKFIENGQLLIKKNGAVYDAIGRAVR